MPHSSVPLETLRQRVNGWYAQAGRDLQSAVHDVAVAASLLLLVVPFALVIFGWLPWRFRWMRRASAWARASGPLEGGSHSLRPRMS